MINRILNRGEGRSDDNMETLLKRLKTYRECTQPIVHFFETQGKLLAINADGDIETIFTRVRTALSLA